MTPHLARFAARATEGLDRIPECARPETQLDSSATQHVQTRGGLGQYRGRTQWQIGHVREEAHSRCGAGNGAEESPGVYETTLVRVILDGHVVQSATFDLLGRGKQRIACVGYEKVAESDLAAVVSHDGSMRRGLPCRGQMDVGHATMRAERGQEPQQDSRRCTSFPTRTRRGSGLRRQPRPERLVDGPFTITCCPLPLRTNQSGVGLDNEDCHVLLVLIPKSLAQHRSAGIGRSEQQADVRDARRSRMSEAHSMAITRPLSSNANDSILAERGSPSGCPLASGVAGDQPTELPAGHIQAVPPPGSQLGE